MSEPTPARSALSKSSKKQKRKNTTEKTPSPKSWSRVALDANFFILAFAQNPQALHRFKEIANRVSFKLYTSHQILKELRGKLKSHVKKAS